MNNLALYQLSTNYLQALDFLTDPGTDLPAEVMSDTLEALTDEFEEKAMNVAKFIRNMESTAEAIKAAEVEMAKRRKSLENRAEWLRHYIKLNMESSGITKIECPYIKLSIQKNPTAVIILDESHIDEKYIETISSKKIDKNAIKEALKAGIIVKGAELSNGFRLVIK